MTAIELIAGRGHTVERQIDASPLKLKPTYRARFNRADRDSACQSAVRRSMANMCVVEIHATNEGWAVFDAGTHKITGTHGYYVAEQQTVYVVGVPKPWEK